MNIKYSINSEISEYQKNFSELYYKSIQPLLCTFEKQRLDMLKKYKKHKTINFIIITLCLILIMFLMVSNSLRNDDMCYKLFWILFISVFISMHIYKDTKIYIEDFSFNLKKNFMNSILDVLGNIRQGNYISTSELEKSELFSAFNYVFPLDTFSGEYKGVPFNIMETYIQQTNTHKSKNDFSGVVIKFRANKNFSGKTIVTPKYDINIKNNGIAFFKPILCIYFIIVIIMFIIGIFGTGIHFEDGIIGVIKFALIFPIVLLSLPLFPVILGPLILHGINPNPKPKSNLNKELNLESADFEKMYKVYSEDEIEGRYLITPAFMERVVNLQNAFGAKGVKIAFYDNTILFAIPTNRNIFELGDLFHSLSNPESLEQFFEEITAIYLIIDHFKLNEKTGL